VIRRPPQIRPAEQKHPDKVKAEREKSQQRRRTTADHEPESRPANPSCKCRDTLVSPNPSANPIRPPIRADPEPEQAVAEIALQKRARSRRDHREHCVVSFCNRLPVSSICKLSDRSIISLLTSPYFCGTRAAQTDEQFLQVLRTLRRVPHSASSSSTALTSWFRPHLRSSGRFRAALRTPSRSSTANRPQVASLASSVCKQLHGSCTDTTASSS
jgi:hypothetical protein